MILYMLRHASAGPSESDPVKDARRPLDKDGIEQCGFIGRALAAMNVDVDLIISSPLKRATQTASMIGNEIGHDGRLIPSPALSREASFDAFRQLLVKYAKQEVVMVVGHNPTLSQFLSLLISGGANTRAVDLKKGAVARLEWDPRKPAVLHWCLTPKVVRSIHELAGKSLPRKSSTHR